MTQYQIAKKKNNTAWMKELRMYASLHQSDAWLTENLDYRPRQRQQIAEGVTVTRDIRLQKDIRLPTRIEEVSQGCSAWAEVPASEQERRVSSLAATEVHVKVEAMEVSRKILPGAPSLQRRHQKRYWLTRPL